MHNTEQETSFYDLFVPLTNLKAIIIIVFIGLSIFFISFFNGFVGDDQPQITGNPVIQSIQNLPSFFAGSTFYTGGLQNLGGVFYRPLVVTYYAFVYSFFGPNSFMFHMLQGLLFITNASFLFLILQKIFKKPLALLLSIIYLIHPINSEAAVYISDMQEVMFFFFGIIALWIIQKYKSEKSLMIASVCLLCSLLSKETGILFIFVNLLYVFLFDKKRINYLLGYLCVVFGIYFLLRVKAIGIFTHTLITTPIQKLSLIERLLNVPAIIFYYLRSFVFPIDLALTWHWVIRQVDFNHLILPLILEVLIFSVIIYFASALYKKHTNNFFALYIFFSVWFLLGLLFHIQLIPLDQIVADRWFYFPIVGLLGMSGVIIQAYQVNLKNKWVLIPLVVLVILLSIRTLLRTFDFKDDFTLASHDVRVSKEAYNLYNDLSSYYMAQGQYEKAKQYAEQSIEIFPQMLSYTNLGAANFYLGNYKQAKTADIKALQYGDYYVTYENLAALSIVYGDSKSNIKLIKNTALSKYPQDATLLYYLAILEYQAGNIDDAKTEILQAYTYNQSPQIESLYTKIMNNQPLNLTIEK